MSGRPGLAVWSGRVGSRRLIDRSVWGDVEGVDDGVQRRPPRRAARHVVHGAFRVKCRYVREHGLAGVMFWEYGADRTGALLQTLFDGLLH